MVDGGATLGRRSWPAEPDPAALRARLTADGLLPIDVERTRAAALLSSLQQRYAQNLATEIYNPTSATHFVRDAKSYSLFHTSTHETADWLTALGCQIHGTSPRADFHLLPAPPPPMSHGHPQP